MELSEDAITFLENQIPILAETASTQAFWQTLASGNVATILQGNEIVEISPDGTRRVIKTIPQNLITVTERHFTINP